MQAGKNGVKDGKALLKLMDRVVYGKAMENMEIELM